MEAAKKYILSIIIFAALITLVYVFRLGGEAYGTLTVLINLVTGIITLFFGYLSLKYFGINTQQGKSILMLTGSVLLWIIADILWSTVFADALVSFSDVLWLLGYPFIFIGVYYGIRTVNEEFFKSKKTFLLVTGVSLMLALAYFQFFPLAWDPASSFIENIVTSGYVLADVLLMVPLILLVALVLGGSLSLPWMLIGIASLLDIIGDVYYNLHADTYASGDLIDLVWYAGYLLYAIAFILMKANAEKLAWLARKTLPQK